MMLRRGRGSRGRSARRGRSSRRGRGSVRRGRRGRTASGTDAEYWHNVVNREGYNHLAKDAAETLTEELIRGGKIDQNEEVKYKTAIEDLAKSSLFEFKLDIGVYSEKPNSTHYTKIVADMSNDGEIIDKNVLKYLRGKLTPEKIVTNWA